MEHRELDRHRAQVIAQEPKPQMLHSAIYEGFVRHRRILPKAHAFTYKVFMMYLDLAELEQVFARSPFWSASKFSLARFRRSDFMGTEDEPLDSAVRDCVWQQTGERLQGPIRLLTNLRYFGFLINPISCYYCFDQQEQLRYIVAEVTSTPWRERVHYVIPCNSSHQTHRFAKQMHVSPFMPMEMTYQWRSRTPNRSLSIHLQNWRNGQEAFNATLALRRVEITTYSLGISLLRYPFMTLKIALAIYWQALKLFLKRMPLFGHSELISSKNR